MEENSLIFHIDKVKQGEYGFEFSGNSFLVLSVRQKTVIVKCNTDEGYRPPYNIHEFPKEIGFFTHYKNKTNP